MLVVDLAEAAGPEFEEVAGASFLSLVKGGRPRYARIPMDPERQKRFVEVLKRYPTFNSAVKKSLRHLNRLL